LKCKKAFNLRHKISIRPCASPENCCCIENYKDSAGQRIKIYR